MTSIIIVEGNVVTDPEIAIVKNGTMKVMTFAFANNYGKEESEVNFFRVSFFQQALFQYIKKGKPMTIIGLFKSNKFTRKDGTQGVSLEIVADRINFTNNNNRDNKNDNKVDNDDKKIIEEKSKAPSPDDFIEEDIPF